MGQRTGLKVTDRGRCNAATSVQDVKTYHSKAMPVILTKPAEWDLWLSDAGSVESVVRKPNASISSQPLLFIRTQACGVDIPAKKARGRASFRANQTF